MIEVAVHYLPYYIVSFSRYVSLGAQTRANLADNLKWVK